MKVKSKVKKSKVKETTAAFAKAAATKRPGALRDRKAALAKLKYKNTRIGVAKEAPEKPLVDPVPPADLGCTKYYYLNQDKVTVCLLTDKASRPVARGVAAWNGNKKTDPFSKETGRHEARKLAVKALYGVTKDRNVVREISKRQRKGTGFGKRWYKNPKLTPLERQLYPHI